MKKVVIVVLSLSASPAFAHHEVIVATSVVPLFSGLFAISVAGFFAWFRGHKK